MVVCFLFCSFLDYVNLLLVGISDLDIDDSRILWLVWCFVHFFMQSYINSQINSFELSAVEFRNFTVKLACKIFIFIRLE